MIDIKSMSDSELLKHKSFLVKEISRLDNLQMGKKIALNSLYGALGNIHFRYYDLRLAESITTTGQLSIRWIANKLNTYLNSAMKTNGTDYVIASDTDSVIGSTIITVDGKPISISDYFDSMPNFFIKNEEDNIVKLSHGKTNSVSTDGGLVESNIRYAMKHKVNKRMFSIKIGDKEVVVTGDHSVIVQNKITHVIESIKPNLLDTNIHYLISINSQIDMSSKNFPRCS